MSLAETWRWVAGAFSGTPAEKFEELYQEHQSMVRAVLFRIAGPDSLDDLVQEAFVRIWKGLPSFRNQSKLSSWIYRVCVNVAVDHGRAATRSKREQRELEQFALENADQGDQRSAERALSEQQVVQQGLEQLSFEHRTVLVLAYFQDLSTEEIGSVLGISLGTVKSRLHYAREEFRLFLRKRGLDHE